MSCLVRFSAVDKRTRNMAPRSKSSSPVVARHHTVSDPLATSQSEALDGQVSESESLLPLATRASASYTDSDSSESVSLEPSDQEPTTSSMYQQVRHSVMCKNPVSRTGALTLRDLSQRWLSTGKWHQCRKSATPRVITTCSKAIYPKKDHRHDHA